MTGPPRPRPRVQVVKSRFAHEPTVLGPTSDGHWLLFHVGAGKGAWKQNKNPPCTHCTNGSDVASCKHLSYPHGSKDFVAPTVLWSATTPRGPWTEVGVVQTPNKADDGYRYKRPVLPPRPLQGARSTRHAATRPLRGPCSAW